VYGRLSLKQLMKTPVRRLNNSEKYIILTHRSGWKKVPAVNRGFPRDFKAW
jgi:hypothetical protein